jgi:hypothetical protein
MNKLELGNIAQWFGAIATLFAVLVALFKEEILRRCRRPKLRVSIKLSPPDCHKTRIFRLPDGFSAECYWLRLWIEDVGKTRAEIIQVFVAKLLRESADRSFKEVEDFLPMNLKWAHSGEVFAHGISPAMGKHCDLGHVIEPQGRKEFPGEDLQDVPDDHTILALDLEFPPATKSHLIRPGRYQLQLKIAASNCAVVEKTLTLSIAGSWFPEESRMFREGLGIEIN